MRGLLVGTLNLRNLADRWWERAPLIFAEFAALQPDALGLQEVVYPLQQDRLIGAAGEARYRALRGWAGRPEYGNAMLVRDGLAVGTPERLDLGTNRSALRVNFEATDGAPSWTFAVTHLHHTPADEAAREHQARDLVAWLDSIPAPAPLVVVGDFNAEPIEPAYHVMTNGGFRSAHLIANGAEPAVTWPSGIVADGMDTDGSPGCLDYIWVRGDVEVESCRLAFDRPAVEDLTLYPSDHLGLVARIRLGG